MSNALEILFQPFGFLFMQQAMAIAILMAIPTSLLSCYLVLRGWSLLGDAAAHAVLPGIFVASLLGIPLAIGAFVAALTCAFGTGFVKDNCRVKEDGAMAIVFSGMFAFGLLLSTKIKTTLHLDHLLFGDLLGVSWSDVAESGVIAALIALLAILKGRDLFALAFDGQHGHAIGLSAAKLHYGLLAALSVSLVAALKSVGIVLTIAMLVAPGAIAFLWARRLRQMIAIALAVSVAMSLLGVYISFFLDSAPAPTIVLLLAVTFLFSLLWMSRCHRPTLLERDENYMGLDRAKT